MRWLSESFAIIKPRSSFRFKISSNTTYKAPSTHSVHASNADSLISANILFWAIFLFFIFDLRVEIYKPRNFIRITNILILRLINILHIFDISLRLDYCDFFRLYKFCKINRLLRLFWRFRFLSFFLFSSWLLLKFFLIEIIRFIL